MSEDQYTHQNYWEAPDLSLLRGYLDKTFCKKVKEKMEKVKNDIRANNQTNFYTGC